MTPELENKASKQVTKYTWVMWPAGDVIERMLFAYDTDEREKQLTEKWLLAITLKLLCYSYPNAVLIKCNKMFIYYNIFEYFITIVAWEDADLMIMKHLTPVHGAQLR